MIRYMQTVSMSVHLLFSAFAMTMLSLICRLKMKHIYTKCVYRFVNSAKVSSCCTFSLKWKIIISPVSWQLQSPNIKVHQYNRWQMYVPVPSTWWYIIWYMSQQILLQCITIVLYVCLGITVISEDSLLYNCSY